MFKRLTAVLVLAFAWMLSAQAFAASGAQMTNARQQFLNGSGAPLASGQVFIYLPNTTTLASTYQDPGLTVSNTNPIILDSNGMASIWVTPGNYREVVQDSLGNVLFDQATSAVGTSAALLSPGATIGTNGDVSCTAMTFTGASAITLPCTINANAVTNADLAQMAANTLKGNNTGATANPSDLTGAQAAAILPAVIGDSGSGGTKGLVPAPAAGDRGKVLTGAGSFQPVAARAWVTFSWNGSSVTVNASYNVASVTRTSQGHYDVTFTNAMTDAYYVPVCIAQKTSTNNAIYCAIDQAASPTTTVLHIAFSDDVAGNDDPLSARLAMFGN